MDFEGALTAKAKSLKDKAFAGFHLRRKANTEITRRNNGMASKPELVSLILGLAFASLRMFDLFREASQSLIAELEHLGDYQSLEAGQELIREGKIDGSIYVLKGGILNVTTSSAAGEQKCLAELEPGSVVGEMSWLENRPAVASVVATTVASVLTLPYEHLEQLEVSNSDLGAEWQQLLARKLALQISSQNAWIHRFSEASKDIEPLRKVLVLFAGLEDQDVNILSNLGVLKRIPPDDVLIRQGEAVDSLYLILAGEAEIYVEIDGVDRQVGSSRRGELLGELTLLLTMKEAQQHPCILRQERKFWKSIKQNYFNILSCIRRWHVASIEA